MAAHPTLNKIFDPADGRTYSEVIITMVRSGLPLRSAALFVGIDQAQIDGWRRDGAKINRSGKPEPGRRTAGQEAMVQFAIGIAQARTLYMATLVEALTALGRGGVVTTHTKSVEVVNAKGEIVEKREETSERTLAPNVAALRFLLTTRYPDEWSPAQRLEVTGVDGGPVQVDTGGSVVDGLLADLERLSERHAAAHVALAAHGVDPDEPSVGVPETAVHVPDVVTEDAPADV